LNIFEEHAEFGWMEVQGEQGGQVLGIGLAGKEDDLKPGINAVVTMVTDSYDQTKIELSKKGISFFGEIGGVPGVPRMICFNDPDGNTLQLIEETPGVTDNVSL
jgi:predicted enzyme related to lactoylglutathione lyase